MQTIKGYLATFLAVLAGVVALWIGTMLFVTLLACAAAAAVAFWLGTGPRPITIRGHATAAPRTGHPAPIPVSATGADARGAQGHADRALRF
ncbi:hypothetical protein [Acidimangrovimonas sediminis]|uniref:hypothetical protein n=1 Tax=Acidimangrovimonas sediminis TaxID=2056283 RepID=UPI000C80DCA7|nr:hypothetical protein [Acidimangrovimonas sediminis]